MYIKNYHEVCETLYSHLGEYLEEHGIDSSKLFRCLNPSHEDKNPSMGLAPSGKAFMCFSCGFSGGIFHAAHILEGKPMVGQEFIQENLIPLAEKYGAQVEANPLTEEQLYELDTYRAYRAAADLVKTGIRSPVFTKAAEARGWNKEICEELGIGCVSDYNVFRDTLKGMGFKAGFLDDIDLGRKEIFGEDRLIFPIRDEQGRPVGFSSRNLAYTGDKENGAKYVNQRGTGVKCNIYRKSTRLYGFDRVLDKAQGKPKPLYIFEGYSDVATAILHGIDNCVGLGGTVLTLEQLLLLKKHKYYDIILCLDGDIAGQNRTAVLLDKVLSGHKDLKVRIVILPEGQDPDEFIRQNGINKFKRLKKWTAFEWRLSLFSEDAEPETICESMIPLIVNETSYVSQEKMCKTLAKETGVSLKSIQHELERIQDQRTRDKHNERQVIIDKLITECKKDPTLAENAIQLAQDELFNLARNYEEDSFSEEATLSIIHSQKIHEESKDGSFSGFRLGSDLYGLEQALCGEWKKDVWICLGGRPNCGKTSFAIKLITEIANHEENNACVIYHSIDDTAEQVLPKFVSVAEGSRKLSLNQVMDPNYHSRNTGDDSRKTEIINRREAGYSTLEGLVRNGRLIIKDANEGSSLSYIERLIRYYRDKYPDRNLVYVLDNFHKLTDFGAGKADERVRTKEISKIVKHLATKYHICIITTVEYRKTVNNQRAGNQDIAETIQIIYDANLVAHIHNELHDKGEKCPVQLVHYAEVPDLEGDTMRLPIVELDIGKNKITAFKERLYLEFFPSSSDFAGVDEAIILSRKAEEDDKPKTDFFSGDK